MASYLVTGGCGFIGSHLVDALIRLGHCVRVLDDLSSGDRANLAPSATLIVGDIRDASVVRCAFEGIDGCFHLAAIASVTRYQDQWQYAHEVNLLGTLNVFQEACRASGNESIPVVYASSAAVYGEARTLPVTEEMPARPISAYGADKAACELHAGVIARGARARLTGLQFFNVYGPRQNPASMYSGAVSIFCDRMFRGEPVDIFGDGRQTRDFIHVSDVVEYLLRAIKSPSVDGVVYNVCTGNPITIADLGKLIAELQGCEFRARFHPPRRGDIRNSAGDPSRAVAQFGYLAEMSLRRGLADLLSMLGVVGRSELSRHPLTIPVGR